MIKGERGKCVMMRKKGEEMERETDRIKNH